MIQNRKMRVSVATAVCAGLGLRLFFVLKYPAANTGDAPFYLELAWNWLKNHVYALSLNGRLVPVDMRAPGYPAFLAAVFALAGKSSRAVMLAQVAVDLATCLAVAQMAALLAPASPPGRPASRHSLGRVSLGALWLSALCPFTANYTAVVLTETLATGLTAVALVLLLETEAGVSRVAGEGFGRSGEARNWLLAGMVAGLGALVRPETPLVLAAAGAWLLARWWRRRDWARLVRAGALMAAGLVLPLLPWAARNWHTLHEVEFLAPRYSELPGEYTPVGFTAWTGTWMWRMRDVYLSTWNVNEAPILVSDLPASAFDSPAERARVAALLARHNDGLALTPEIDAGFAEIAKQRTARHRLRTEAEIPALRAFALWFTPRTELLPISGHLTPLRQAWQEDQADFLVTALLGIVGVGFLALALAGAWGARAQPGVKLLLLFIAIRTIYFAYAADTSEPRYVLECFPAVIALAAQVFLRRADAAGTAPSLLRPAQDES